MSAATPFPVLRAAGEGAVIVEFGDTVDMAVNNAAIAFEARVRRMALEGVIETTPTIRSTMVRFDPLALPPDRLRGRLEALLAEQDWLRADPPEGRRRWRLPAVYGGAAGPDLAEAAELMGMSEAAAIESHASAVCRVLMLGFAPGLAYLGRLPEAWALPRLKEIRPPIPPGTFCVAVRQTVLSATSIPTGWRLIGRTSFRNFHPERDPPFLLSPGDEVCFEPVEALDFDDPPQVAPEALD